MTTPDSPSVRRSAAELVAPDCATLLKYEGLGNDFLLLNDPQRSLRFDVAFVSALCDRHRGFGADGLIRLSRDDRDLLRMELRNADGSFAETSGNGLRCAALGTLDLGLVAVPSFVIGTDAGIAAVEIAPGQDSNEVLVRVEMGKVTVREVASSVVGFRAFRADVGNPHLVLVGDAIGSIDLTILGPQLGAEVPGGINVEVIAPASGFDGLELAVWERGVGLTQACGSGSCAAAAAARLVGISGDRVTVANPGGRLSVELVGNDPTGSVAFLTGPTRRVGRVVFDPADFGFNALAEVVHA